LSLVICLKQNYTRLEKSVTVFWRRKECLSSEIKFRQHHRNKISADVATSKSVTYKELSEWTIKAMNFYVCFLGKFYLFVSVFFYVLNYFLPCIPLTPKISVIRNGSGLDHFRLPGLTVLRKIILNISDTVVLVMVSKWSVKDE
jgi:hypothetical protein